MRHLDLFSGIGGFALAAKWVWGDEHKIHSFVKIDRIHPTEMRVLSSGENTNGGSRKLSESKKES